MLLVNKNEYLYNYKKINKFYLKKKINKLLYIVKTK